MASRLELMTQLMYMREIIPKLQKIYETNGDLDLEQFVLNMRKESHDLANRIQVMDCQALNLD